MYSAPMSPRFLLPAARLVILGVTLAACSDTSGGRSTGDAREGSAPSASEALAPETAPLRTELKRRIRTDMIPATRAVFGLIDPAESKLEVTFFDTPSLDLIQAGIILRLRKVKGGSDDVTVKLRPLARTAVAAAWFEQDGFKCEEDSIGATSVDACSLTLECKASDIDKVVAGGKGIESILSGRQLDFLRTYGRLMPDWDGLVPFGPIAAKEWHVSVQQMQDKLAAEVWTLPGGTELLEFSVKVPSTDAGATAVALDDVFRIRGIELITDGKSKTRAALETLRTH